MTTVRAPGKMVLTGAYAVLEGAPAIVVAVDRYARVDASRRSESPTAEVREALGDAAPHWDASALYEGEKKLGLGSSAAVLVASLGAQELGKGRSLEDPDVRARIFARAREVHGQVQGGGSGVDVAAATYGGVMRYSLQDGRPWMLHAALPAELTITPFFSGTSARTSDLLGQVRALRARDAEEHARRMADLSYAAELAAERIQSGSIREIVEAVRTFGEALDQLGDAADADIVPLEFKRLALAAAEEGAAFVPSGAGGGDLGVYFAAGPPSAGFQEKAERLGMRAVALRIEHGGVRVDDGRPAAEREDQEDSI